MAPSSSHPARGRRASSRALPVACAMLLAGGACGVEVSPHAATASPPATEPAMQQDSFQIRQGASATRGDSRLGFIGSDGAGGALLDAWDQRHDFWLVHYRLRDGDIFPASGRFLRVTQIRHGEPGGSLSLDVAGDAGGLLPAAADQPVLPERGSLDVGLSRLEMLSPPDAHSVRVRRWPKLHPLARTAPEQIEELALSVGDTLAFGNRTLRVERIQSDAGDIGGFVVFSVAD